MSDEECNLVMEVLNTIGQFDGLAHFEWLERFKIGLGLKDRPKIISFSNNPYLKNSNLLGTLFDYISNKVVIRLAYHTFKDTESRTYVLHPYLLKQYNNRWYLCAAVDSNMNILTFALDRIDKVEPLLEIKYVECPVDLAERFEDIVGITFYEDRTVEHILFWVSNVSKDYVDTKPIHGSQTLLKGEKERRLREQYLHLQGGVFYTIDCVRNYELIRELCSYGETLVVISPVEIRMAIIERLFKMLGSYSKISPEIHLLLNADENHNSNKENETVSTT